MLGSWRHHAGAGHGAGRCGRRGRGDRRGESAYGPVITNQRTSIKFVNPQGMKVHLARAERLHRARANHAGHVQLPAGERLPAAASWHPGPAGRVYYPTLEIAPVTPKTMTFLAHNTVPVAFTDDDFERVNAGNLVIKVIYLPDPMFQDLAAVAGAEEVVSTQLRRARTR